MAQAHMVIVIDPGARTLTVGEKPAPEWLGFRVPSYTLIDGIGELHTRPRRTRDYCEARFKLPNWTRPSDGAVFERVFAARAYVVPTIDADRALAWLTANLTWIPRRS